MPQNYGFIYFLLAVLLLAVVGILILVVRFVSRTICSQTTNPGSVSSNEVESDSAGSESGEQSSGWYIIATLAAVFLMQMVFLVPWAVKIKALGIFGLIEILVFLGVVILGYAWLWKKDAIEWM